MATLFLMRLKGGLLNIVFLVFHFIENYYNYSGVKEMGAWHDELLKSFRGLTNSVTIVKDIDYLLDDELLMQKLSQLGFEIIRYENSIHFRYLYERNYRTQGVKLIIYLNENFILPYEFEKVAEKIELSINYLFPKFDGRIIRQINNSDFEELFEIHKTYSGSSSSLETLQYITKHLYHIPLESLDNHSELYRVLLSFYQKHKAFPKVISQFLSEYLGKVKNFHDLPLKSMFSTVEEFYCHLESEWIGFLNEYNKDSNEQISESTSLYTNHPFNSYDVSLYLKDLFISGKLKKATYLQNLQVPEWMKFGIDEGLGEKNVEAKIQLYKEQIEEKIHLTKNHKDWIEMVKIVAKYKYTILENDSFSENERVSIVFKRVNEFFQKWMLESYHSLMSLPPIPTPKMVHHLPHFLAKIAQKEKVALLVLDGMSFVQWQQVRSHLKQNNFSYEESGVFAWVPTLTAISRQAIFSGNMPIKFQNSIRTTANEEKQWKDFWINQGIAKQYIGYQKSLGMEPYNREEILPFKRPSLKIYGAVIDTVDELMHGERQGDEGLFRSLDLWLKRGYLVELLNDLIVSGYTVYLTSDHGNTVAKGIGRISEGVLVDQKGERVRVYNEPTIYENSKVRNDAIAWSKSGLPDDYLALLSKYGEAFVPKGEEIITHGSISIEEVIVPFVKMISNRER